VTLTVIAGEKRLSERLQYLFDADLPGRTGQDIPPPRPRTLSMRPDCRRRTSACRRRGSSNPPARQLGDGQDRPGFIASRSTQRSPYSSRAVIFKVSSRSWPPFPVARGSPRQRIRKQYNTVKYDFYACPAPVFSIYSRSQHLASHPGRHERLGACGVPGRQDDDPPLHPSDLRHFKAPQAAGG